MAQPTSLSSRLKRGTSRPAGIVPYEFWVKTTDNTVWVYNGTTDVQVGGNASGAVPTQPDAPPSPVDGQLWYDDDDASFSATVPYAPPAPVAYTPTLTGFTQSSGQTRWMQVGEMVTAWGSHTISAVTSDFSVALPVAAAPGYGSLAVGSYQAFDTGTARYGGTVALNGTANVYFVINGGTGAGALVGLNKPFAWAAGDVFTWSATYEAA